jgi:Arc/MetJ family transcription regulator
MVVMYILPTMTKRLVEIDDALLAAAKAELQADTIKDTVNEALRRVADERVARVDKALDFLANFDFLPREEMWR